MAASLSLLWRIIRTYGLAWTLRRAWYEAQRRVGWFERRHPAWEWHERPLNSWLRFRNAWHSRARLRTKSPLRWTRSPTYSGSFQSTSVDLAFSAGDLSPRRGPPRFFWHPDDIAPLQARLRALLADHADGVIAEADAALNGRLRYFSGLAVEAGSPPAWHHDPIYDVHWPRQAHWSRLESLPASADIKRVWEPARFAVAYLWVRAYWLSGDERYPAAFWAWFEDWLAHNPPLRGVHWLDGQECAFRVMAWTFALHGFATSPHTTPERVRALILALAAHAERIAANRRFAELQSQNHAISEAVGLYTVGLLFPGLQKAARWRELGRAGLERAARTLIAPDGGFVQNSVNYQRLMLDDYLWAARLADLNGEPLSEALLGRVWRAAEMLYQLQDETTGTLPNYGANDGALILPLTACAYRDYRPTLTTVRYLRDQKRLYEAGPWDEMLLWLFSVEAPNAPLDPPPRQNLNAAASGYCTLRGEDTFAFIRAHTYKTRPMQSDALHLDLWWRGLNIAQDAGTYSYNAPPPWRRGLAGADVHNTVTLDGQDHMTRGPRFLWFDWAQAAGRFLAARTFQAVRRDRRHPDFRHVRTVTLLENEGWRIEDVIVFPGEHTARLHWLLGGWPYRPDGEHGLILETPQGEYALRITADGGDAQTGIVRGSDERTTRGWTSPTYYVREAALSVVVEVSFTDRCEFRSVFTALAGMNDTN